MNLKRVGVLIALIGFLTGHAQSNRPQEPKEPFDYQSEQVVFDNSVDSISLAGTFTYPKSGSHFTAVVLISGSGPQDRNSELLGHKSFLVIADHLTRNGIAVLRVDDRGTGESEGVYNDSGLNDFVRDTESALQYLQTRSEVDQSKIGLIGHSLGGVIAPIVASQSKDISFIILLAGSGITGDELMLLQKEQVERKMMVPEPGIAVGQSNMKGAYDIILASGGDQEQLKLDLMEYFNGVFGKMIPESQIAMLSEQLAYPWLVDFIKYDPKTALIETTCPVLAINGSNDLQVPADENLEAIEKYLEEGGNDKVEIVKAENLNHLFQESESGLPTEYAKIEQTFSPVILDLMTDWIKKQDE